MMERDAFFNFPPSPEDLDKTDGLLEDARKHVEAALAAITVLSKKVNAFPSPNLGDKRRVELLLRQYSEAMKHLGTEIETTIRQHEEPIHDALMSAFHNPLGTSSRERYMDLSASHVPAEDLRWRTE